MIILLILLSFLLPSTFADEVSELKTFSGRISMLNNKASLMRIKVKFKNMKFLNKRDRVEFWNEMNPRKRCAGYLVGKTNDYLLLKVPNYDLCISKVYHTVGSYLHFESKDMIENIKEVRDLISILVKKKMALETRMKRHRKDLDTYIEKIEAVNGRFQTLRDKLMIEWQKELSALQDDKMEIFKDYKQAEADLDSIYYKLEKYRIHDKNMRLDRWSIDPRLYKKK